MRDNKPHWFLRKFKFAVLHMRMNLIGSVKRLELLFTTTNV